jgi:surface protein
MSTLKISGNIITTSVGIANVTTGSDPVRSSTLKVKNISANYLDVSGTTTSGVQSIPRSLKIPGRLYTPLETGVTIDGSTWTPVPPPPIQNYLFSLQWTPEPVGILTITGTPYTVDWGDGTTIETNVNAHDYTGSPPGPWDVIITSNDPTFGLQFDDTNLAYISVIDPVNVPIMYQMLKDVTVDLTEYNLDNWNTINVKNMGRMFYQSQFNNTVSPWNVSNVITMSEMFSNSPFNQPLTDWDTSNVVTMSAMFQNSPFDQSLATFDTINVTTIENMFYGSVFNNNVSNWNTSNVTNMSAVFFANPVFNKSLAGWDTSKVNTMYGMFQGASAFNQQIFTFNTINVTNMAAMFQGASAFNYNISNWNTSNVTNMAAMFQGASTFNTFVFANTINVTDMSDMFNGASKFNAPLPWNTSNVTTMRNMFAYANEFANGLANPLLLNTSKVTDMSYMFANCLSMNNQLLHTPGTAKWDTSKVVNMTGMFANCATFTTNEFVSSLNNWNVSNVTTMENMFSTVIPNSVFSDILNGWVGQGIQSDLIIGIAATPGAQTILTSTNPSLQTQLDEYGVKFQLFNTNTLIEGPDYYYADTSSIFV